MSQHSDVIHKKQCLEVRENSTSTDLSATKLFSSTFTFRAQEVNQSPGDGLGGITARGLTNLHIIPQKHECQFWLLHPRHTWKGGKTCIQRFNRMQTSTDLTATKLFSHNREGMFQQDGARTHTSKATIA